MRRRVRVATPVLIGAVLIGAVLISTVLIGALCGCGNNPEPEPTLPSVNFTPKATITVDDGALAVDGHGPNGETLEVGSGTVIEVDNVGPDNERVQGGTGGVIFDTGTLEPGDTTIVVLTKAGEIEVHTIDHPDPYLTIVVGDRQS